MQHGLGRVCVCVRKAGLGWDGGEGRHLGQKLCC